MLGGQLSWVLLLFVPVIVFSAVRIGRRVRSTTRHWSGPVWQDVQNILHETITGNRIVKAFGMESWEVARFRKAAQRLFPRESAVGGRGLPQFAAYGHILGSIAIALLLLLGSRTNRTRPPLRLKRIRDFCRGRARRCTIRRASLPFSITVFSRLWAHRRSCSNSWTPRTSVLEKPGARVPSAVFAKHPTGRRLFLLSARTATSRARSCTASTLKCDACERFSRSSAPAVPARARWFISSPASSM
jgi:hypothetical protein